MAEQQKTSPTNFSWNELRKSRPDYGSRLENIALRTVGRSDLLRGTTVSRPTINTKNFFGSVKESATPYGYAMCVRSLEIADGFIVTFPLFTTGVEPSGEVINVPPSESREWSVLFQKKTSPHQLPEYIPSRMHNAWTAFSIDAQDAVYINGTKTTHPNDLETLSVILDLFEDCIE